MELGIFAKTFVRPSFESIFDAVAAHGLRSVQFNMACAGLDSMPNFISNGLVDRIHDAADARGIGIAALSGTFNMAHPDPLVRERGIAALWVLAAACRPLGASVITLCTGTRDPDDMWRRHPENDSRDAWADLRATLEAALTAAEKHDVTLAFEPEPANVVNSAPRGRRLLCEVRNPRLAVVIDPANIVATDRNRAPADALAEAFDLLGDQIAVAHAKDLDNGGKPCAAGTGIVPWDRYVALLRDARFTGPLILHGLAEDEVPAAVGFLRDRANDVRGAS